MYSLINNRKERSANMLRMKPFYEMTLNEIKKMTTESDIIQTWKIVESDGILKLLYYNKRPIILRKYMIIPEISEVYVYDDENEYHLIKKYYRDDNLTYDEAILKIIKILINKYIMCNIFIYQVIKRPSFKLYSLVSPIYTDSNSLITSSFLSISVLVDLERP